MARRNENGQALVEMLIAIGLSGVLVLMLSGMLSQTLLVSTVSQNELIAAQAAEELLENARTMTYTEISNLISQSYITVGQPMTFVVNLTQTAQPLLIIRQAPVQLDLTNTVVVFGEVNPSSTLLVNANAKWGPGFGNMFSGTATETVNKFTSGTLQGYEIDVVVSYNGTYANSGGTANSKTLKRTAYVMKQGLNFQ
jgi:type II secretory pathway pseudopilin PulG